MTETIDNLHTFHNTGGAFVQAHAYILKLSDTGQEKNHNKTKS